MEHKRTWLQRFPARTNKESETTLENSTVTSSPQPPRSKITWVSLELCEGTGQEYGKKEMYSTECIRIKSRLLVLFGENNIVQRSSLAFNDESRLKRWLCSGNVRFFVSLLYMFLLSQNSAWIREEQRWRGTIMQIRSDYLQAVNDRHLLETQFRFDSLL